MSSPPRSSNENVRQYPGETKPKPDPPEFPKPPKRNASQPVQSHHYPPESIGAPSQPTYEGSTYGYEMASPTPSHYQTSPGYSQHQYPAEYYQSPYTQASQQQAYPQTPNRRQPYMTSSGHATGGANGVGTPRVTAPIQQSWSAWSEWRWSSERKEYFTVRQDTQGKQETKWQSEVS